MLSFALYYSFRSPYSYLATPQLEALRAKYEFEINLKVVRPIAVRIPGFFKQVERAVKVALSLPDARQGQTPPIRALLQPHMVAKGLSDLQALERAFKIVVLAAQLAHPDMHVNGAPQRRQARPLCGLQGLLERAGSLLQSAARDVDVG